MAKWGSCDFKQLKDLQKKMEKFEQNDLEEFCEMCAKQLAARLLKRVINRTPVGKYKGKPVFYVTGEKGTPIDSSRHLVAFDGKNTRQGGTLRRSWSEENKVIHVKHKRNEFICEIVNSTEYAIYVEYGHRTADHKGWVNGRFILEKATLELDKQAPRIVEKELMKKLGEIFNDQ